MADFDNLLRNMESKNEKNTGLFNSLKGTLDSLLQRVSEPEFTTATSSNQLPNQQPQQQTQQQRRNLTPPPTTAPYRNQFRRPLTSGHRVYNFGEARPGPTGGTGGHVTLKMEDSEDGSNRSSDLMQSIGIFPSLKNRKIISQGLNDLVLGNLTHLIDSHSSDFRDQTLGIFLPCDDPTCTEKHSKDSLLRIMRIAIAQKNPERVRRLLNTRPRNL